MKQWKKNFIILTLLLTFFMGFLALTDSESISKLYFQNKEGTIPVEEKSVVHVSKYVKPAEAPKPTAMSVSIPIADQSITPGAIDKAP